jgi:hypothetical protein
MSRRRPGRDREHLRPARSRQVKLRLSEREFADLAGAGVRSGLTPSGYAAEAALAAARAEPTPADEPWRRALSEVIAARTQVRRFGTNVNQAVRVLNTTGEPPEWLDAAVATASRAVESLDAAAIVLAARLSGTRRRPPRERQ